MKKVGTINNETGNFIISDLSILEPINNQNITIQVDSNSKWTVWYDVNDYSEIKHVYLSVNDNSIFNKSEFKLLDRKVNIESTQLAIMDLGYYGNEKSIGWDIKNTTGFDNKINKFYIAVYDELVKEDIALFPFGVAVQLLEYDECEIRLKIEKDSVVGILISVEEMKEENKVSYLDEKIETHFELNKEEDSIFLKKFLEEIKTFYENDKKILNYSLRVNNEKIRNQVQLLDYSTNDERYRIAIESPCLEYRINTFEQSYFEIPEWYKKILRVANGIKIDLDLFLYGVSLTKFNGLSHELQSSFSRGIDDDGILYKKELLEEYFFFGKSFTRDEYYAIKKSNNDGKVYCFDYNSYKLKKNTTTFQDLIISVWKQYNY